MPCVEPVHDLTANGLMFNGRRSSMATTGRRPRRLRPLLGRFLPASVRWDALRFAAIVTAVVLCAFLGGSARADVRWLLVLRPLLIATAAALMLLPATAGSRNIRAPALLFAAFALAIAIQLIPLPPATWAALPGHEAYAQAAMLGRFVQPWHPVTLTPWLTWNALLALLPAAVLLFGLRRLEGRWEHRLVEAYLLLLGASTLLGLAQLAGLLAGPPFSYRFITEHSAIGFFANRNHQAAFLATGFPVLRLWAFLARTPASLSRRHFVAAAAALFLVVVILVTGSRSGMFVALASLAGSAFMAPLPFLKVGMSKTQRRWITAAAIAVPVAIALLLIIFGKALAFDRIVDDDLTAEKRVTYLPIILEQIGAFFPFGSGFGSFDVVFRAAEPESALGAKYFNHAHNDLLELTLTGGLPALLVLIAALVWVAMRSWKAVRREAGEDAMFARAGAISTGVWLLASLTDYPLRTPLAGAAIVISMYWLCPPATARVFEKDASA